MGFGFKKLCFLGFLLVFISFFFSNCFAPPESIDEPAYTNVEYSEDGKSLTIYMDGSAPVPANRSLTNTLARMGHDFFEVTFLYNTGSGPDPYIIARASWELGEPAGISGVYRTAGGVNYYGTKPVGIPDATEGSVVLFVGRRTDKTLLAVGTLSHIDDTPVTTNPNITLTTKKVSFEVNALQSSVDRTYIRSSFQITSPNAPQSGELDEIRVGGEMFPFFHLPVNVTATATYTIGVSSGAHPYAFYAPAIICADGAIARNIQPHYTLPPSSNYSTVQSNSKYGWADDNYAKITLNPTPSAGLQFSGTVGFLIQIMGMTADEGRICSLSFQVPVYAVSSSSDSAGNAPIQWQIKPAYNQYYEELDNGIKDNGNGGAVLIGIGKIEGGKTGLMLYGEPKKFNNVDGLGLDFTLEGFEIYFNTGSDLINLTRSDSSNYPFKFWAFYDYLTFYYDPTPKTFDPDDPGTQLTEDNRELPFGDILIRVKYEPTLGTPYWLSFFVEVYDVGSTTDIPYKNRIFIAKPNDFLEIGNIISSPGNYLLVFSTNINIPQLTLNNMNDTVTGVTIYIVSTVPGIIVGRGGDIVFDGNGDVTIYLGKWPFNEPAFAGGNVVSSESFTMRSRGAFDGAPTYDETDPWFKLGPYSSVTLTIKQFPGVTIDYHDNIPVTGP